MKQLSHFRSAVFLSLTAIIWGIAFVFQSMGNNYMQPFTFNAVRNLLGCIVLVPLVLLRLNKPGFLGAENKPIDKKMTVIGGICCGLALAVAGTFQQYGIKYTTVGKAGFITTLYIILTPIFGLFLRKKCPVTVWIGAFGAVIGLYMLCITESLSLSAGDLLVFICAIFFSVHILVIDFFSPKTDGVLLSCIQFFVCAVICGVFSLIIDHPTWEQISQGAIPILYTGIMSSGVAYTLQIIGQRNFNPTIAALIMSMESVLSAVASFFAYKFGFLTQDQSMTTIQMLGCAIMFLSVVFVQLPFDKLRRKTH